MVACEDNEMVSQINLFFSLPVLVLSINPTTLAVSSALKVDDDVLDSNLFSIQGSSVDSYYGFVMLAINGALQPLLLRIDLNAGGNYLKIIFQR